MGLNVDRVRVPGQYVGDRYDPLDDVSADNGWTSIRVVRGIGGADEYVATSKDNVILAAAVRCRARKLESPLVPVRRIDDHKVRVGVFVLQRPQGIRGRVDF